MILPLKLLRSSGEVVVDVEVRLDEFREDHYVVVVADIASNDVVVETMKSVGAVIESSQWFGWVPLENECPTAGEEGLDASVFKISDVVVVGELVQGPEPAECAALATSSLHK